MNMLAGKKFVILGVANEKSIAWGIAQELKALGAELALTYVNESIEKRVRPLAAELGCETLYKCDVQSDSEVDALFKSIRNDWGSLDGVVHSVAYANREDLHGRFSDVSRAGFNLAMEVSAYSLIVVSKFAAPLLAESKGSVLTLTYLGSERVVPNYGVMGAAKAALESSVRYLAWDLGKDGVRVNGISAGPIRTLAASGIPQFREMLGAFVDKAPLHRAVEISDVGKAATFLLSPAAVGMTGEIMFVDCGFNVMGV